MKELTEKPTEEQLARLLEKGLSPDEVQLYTLREYFTFMGRYVEAKENNEPFFLLPDNKRKYYLSEEAAQEDGIDTTPYNIQTDKQLTEAQRKILHLHGLTDEQIVNFTSNTFVEFIKQLKERRNAVPTPKENYKPIAVKLHNVENGDVIYITGTGEYYIVAEEYFRRLSNTEL